MADNPENFGKTIQLFLVDGIANGLIITSLYGWTGRVIVCQNATFPQMLKREEMKQAGVYLLYTAEDPNDVTRARIYVGEAEYLQRRMPQSAEKHDFWEKAVAITTTDKSFTKGHVRYLEARLIELIKKAGRSSLANDQQPDAESRHLPEADKANMDAFLANLKLILPVIGVDIIKSRPKIIMNETKPIMVDNTTLTSPLFEIHQIKTGLQAKAQEIDGDFMVLKASEALKNTGNISPGYGDLRNKLIQKGILEENNQIGRLVFTRDYVFKSPSAAAAVILDRNANGRTEWKVKGEKTSYQQWQEQQAEIERQEAIIQELI